MDKQNIIKLGLDLIHHRVSEQFSDQAKNEQALREQLLEANGGSYEVNIKSFRRNPEFFEIIEAWIPDMVEEGLKGNEFFTKLVEYRNASHGDSFEFKIKRRVHYIVSKATYGNGGIRRQRLQKGDKVTVETDLRVIQLYDDLERFLAGKVTIDELVDDIAGSYAENILEDIYAAFVGITETTPGLNSKYVAKGTYSEDVILDLVQHVEAATGMKATIIGTKKALRKLNLTNAGEAAKADWYKLGYYGNFNGTECYSINQVHKVGTTDFLFDDSTIYVIAGDDKPIKVCDVGNGYFDIDNPLRNGDHSQNVVYGQEYGVATIFASAMGRYTIS